MEDTLRVVVKDDHIQIAQAVLILVVMEDTLRANEGKRLASLGKS